MVATVQFKRRMASAHIFSVIIRKLGYWQEPCPVILLKIDEGPKIYFDYAVLTFGLTVYLLVEDG